jgi:nitrogen fixation NifU-like protein
VGDQSEAFDFDRIVEQLQQEIDEQERAIYSAKVIEEARNPTDVGRMAEADASAVVCGWCGDTMEIYLRLDGERVEQATFITDGCGPSVACGSKLTTMVRGKSLEEARMITPQDLIDALDGLPEDSLHCADLTVNTLRQAIANRHTEASAGMGQE